MSDVKYVCSINVGDRYRNMLMAGTPFQKEQLVEHTFETLMRQRYIYEYNVEAPINTMGLSKGKLLASIPSTVPAAALHPPKLSRAEQAEADKQAAIMAKAAKAAKAKAKADKANEAAKKAEEAKEAEEEAAEILEAPKAPAKTKSKSASTVEQIWTADPEKLKDVPFEQLYSAYRTQCDKFKLTPEDFNDDKELLIMQLSQDFKK